MLLGLETIIYGHKVLMYLFSFQIRFFLDFYFAIPTLRVLLMPLNSKIKLVKIYSGVHIRMDKPRFMKQMAYFWPSLVGNKNAITPQPFRLHFDIDCSFKMRYYMNFYLIWHRSYERLKLKACFLLGEFGSSKFVLP